jgi:long-chain fatty acid transport protein
MKQGVRRLVWSLLIFTFAVGAWASGTLVEEQGARASAQGGAFAARADDPSALFYNPAGIAFQQTSFQLGFDFINEHMKYEGPAGNTTGPVKTYWPIYSYLVYRTPGIVSFGLAITAPHALATEWNDDWAGAAISARTKQTAIYYSPTIAFRLGDKWSLALTANFVYSNIYLRQTIFFPSIPYPTPPLNRTPAPGMGVLRGTGDGVGWGISALGKLDEHWQLGLMYRSRVTIGYSGGVDFYNIPTSPNFTPLFPNTRAFSSITLPAVGTLAAAYRTKKWDVEVDATYQQWDVFNMLNIDFVPNQGKVQDSTVPQYWKNIWKYKIGFEYRLSDKWSYGVGYFYDESPVPDQYASPILPDSNRNGFTGGLNWQGKKWGVQSYLMYLPFQNKNVPTTTPFVPGTYKAYAILGGLSVTYKF